jgi:(E)-4-hydroxy-3-methylbut-2-enyl-diphosphate synthase
VSYCASRFHTVRRRTVEVKVGGVGIGGSHPIRVQSMTTSDTQDIDATVRQSIALAEVGCEIVRVTAPNVPAAKCLKDIRARLSAAGFGHVPLVADIHFLPGAAMEAVEHVEKVRVNPGNYADKKKFAVKEYTDAAYDAELERLHDAFSPLVLRCKALGRALRIGTNHGSLSDRIMNRYGDTPLGMVESALEFVRICESHGFHDIILSMKASNPKVMIQAYRLLVEKMDAAHRPYPLHLGVTEAGDGEDGRIKSAIGIGSLLLDGLGDTIRVSLTEDSVYEIPVARALADKAMSLWAGRALNPRTAGDARHGTESAPHPEHDAIDPFTFRRRETVALSLAPGCVAGGEQPPRVIVTASSVEALPGVLARLASPALKDTPAEGVLVPAAGVPDLAELTGLLTEKLPVPFLAVEADPSITANLLHPLLIMSQHPLMIVRRFIPGEDDVLREVAKFVRNYDHSLCLATTLATVAALAPTLREIGTERLLFALDTASPADDATHAIGAHRQLFDALRQAGLRAPVWIRNSARTAVQPGGDFLGRLLEASVLTGSLLCDGLGELVSIETETDPVRATKLAYNVLQGAGARISKTEFVACPSCGRTLFDLQTTTQRIRAQTGHLKGVKIAIMGCIVNGPGEMADADFGYVGGAPGKINLYVGKTCVQYNIPQAEADARLIALIREHGKWIEPEPVAAE